MTIDTAKPRHKHCRECGSDFEGPRDTCNECILKEHDKIVDEARAYHEPEPDQDHEPEHEAEAEDA